jgi:hypothetical protein
MSALDFTAVRNSVVSAVGAVLLSVVIVGATVFPAQTAVAATTR